MTTNQNQILLRLNSEAIASLFPDGTQARVDLQSAVIAEFARKHIKPMTIGEEAAKQIRAARTSALEAIEKAEEDMHRKVLADQGVQITRGGRVELSNEAKAFLNDAVRQAIREEIAAQVKAMRGIIAHDVRVNVARQSQQHDPEDEKAIPPDLNF